MNLIENIWQKETDTNKLLDGVEFCISQFKKSESTLSDIQHKKVLKNIDVDFEELIGILLSCREKLKQMKGGVNK